MSTDRMNERYGDIRLFLWLIPCINVVNYYLTYSHVGSFGHLALTFTIDTGQGYISWVLIRYVINWLDGEMPYSKKPVRRMLAQLLLTLVVGLGCIILLTEAENRIATTRPVPRSFYTTDVFIIAIWFFVINAIYTGKYYYNQWQDSERRLKQETEKKFDGVRVTDARKEIFLGFADLAGFYIDGDYAVVVTMEKRKFLLDSSLDKVEKTLPLASFYRLNRQYIVHRQVVTGFEKGENGKINVLLQATGHLPGTVPVSRTRAPAFKSWMTPA